MTPEEAYAEAVRRIKDAKKGRKSVLDLGDLPLDRLPEEIGSLSRLRVLALGRRRPLGKGDSIKWEYERDRPRKHFSDLRPLSSLRNLTSLDLSETAASELSALSPLAGLRSLNLSETKVSELSPLSPLA